MSIQEAIESLVMFVSKTQGEDESVKFLVKLLYDKCDGDKDEMDDIWEIIRKS